MKTTKSVLITFALLGFSFPAFAVDLLKAYRAAQGQDSVFAAARSAQRAGQEKQIGRAHV